MLKRHCQAVPQCIRYQGRPSPDSHDATPTTSITTQFKKLATRNNVFIVSVIVQSNCHFPPLSVSALLLDDALLKCVVTEIVLFSVVAFKTVTFRKVV